MIMEAKYTCLDIQFVFVTLTKNAIDKLADVPEYPTQLTRKRKKSTL